MPRAALCALLALAACDTTIHEPNAALPDAAPTGKCLEATQHADFVWIRDNVLQTSCAAFSSCHQGANPPGALDLTAAHAYAQLVNVASSEAPTWQRVAPYLPDRSFLMAKLGAVTGPSNLDGGLMPPSSPPICSQKIDAIRRWIAAGAFAGVVDAGVRD